MPTGSDLERITSALLKIHKANALERQVYLVMSATSFVVLLVVSVHAYFSKEIPLVVLASLFAATGAIGFCITRILSMWRDCLSILRTAIEKGAGS